MQINQYGLSIIKMLRKFASQVSLNQLKELKSLLPSWSVSHDSSELRKTFYFNNSQEAWDFVETVGKIAAKNQCPPAWSLSHNSVAIKFPPESKQELTNGQVWLASFMDKAGAHIKQDESMAD
ncbi:unnamed protein product [Blepharisma stoltei]|uniref:4a-hydroxytetrahydrobiopterin dehydratase n=1 Tax=Blepharisma stoltei TaxID=1481888 RepID=A0AAU9JZN5_9CILI|nr:unnamed protein product [Blepharisma stoltei]